jgi:hypothetical protein
MADHNPGHPHTVATGHVLLGMLARSGWSGADVDRALDWPQGTMLKMIQQPERARIFRIFEFLGLIQVHPALFYDCVGQVEAAGGAMNGGAMDGGAMDGAIAVPTPAELEILARETIALLQILTCSEIFTADEVKTLTQGQGRPQ